MCNYGLQHVAEEAAIGPHQRLMGEASKERRNCRIMETPIGFFELVEQAEFTADHGVY